MIWNCYQRHFKINYLVHTIGYNISHFKYKDNKYALQGYNRLTRITQITIVAIIISMNYLQQGEEFYRLGQVEPEPEPEPQDPEQPGGDNEKPAA